MRRVAIVAWISTMAVLGVFVTLASALQPSESATYMGSQTCLGCHNATTGPALGTVDRTGWQETLHANIYRAATTETMIGDFNSAPVEFKVGDATLTASFDDGGGSGPWTVRLQGATFDTTMTVVRAHGGYWVDDNEDPVLPTAPGRRKGIGKQRYHVKIGNSYYILPTQWNPFPDRDGENQGWVAYHPDHWMDSSGNWALSFKRSEELRCSGCHQVGPGPSVTEEGEYVLAEADNPSFWNIGCESCHGPGSEHVAAGGHGPIVNPKDLSIADQNLVCGKCHQRIKGDQIGGNNTDYPYSATLGRTHRPGEPIEGFVTSDVGGYWPDGTSSKHHQQYPDFQKSKHFTEGNLSCMSCHVAHNETSAEHDLVRSARDNSLCTQCHSALSDQVALAKHTRHDVDLAKGIGRCVDCHMPAVQKSGVKYDIHAHTFEPMSPQTTIDTQADGGTPNSCAVSCHGDGLLGSATFGLSGSLGTWNEAADVSLAKDLMNFFQWIGEIGPLSDRAQSLEVAQVSTAPKIDGSANDVAWSQAPMTNLVGGAKLQAVTDGEMLYVLAKWPDATASFTRGGSWSWDGSAWSTSPSSGQSEDRLAIAWNINAAKFGEQGCGVKCHTDVNEAGGEDDAFMDTPGERLDMWHMKAARALASISASQSGPLTIDPVTHEVTAGSITLNGYTDDKYTGPYSASNSPDGGRYGDAGSSVDSRNRNAAKTGPLYIESNPTDYVDAMTLRQAEIDGGEVLVIAEASASEISAAWANYEALGAVVPERFQRTPAGSRGDVRQSATWSNGVWVSEYSRALVTDTDDDVQFDDQTKTYPFGLATMDNTGGEGHQIADRLINMTFQAGAPPVVVQPSQKSHAVVNVTVTDNGVPVSGAKVSLARSIGGRAQGTAWEGTTAANGTAAIEIVDNTVRTGATGYYTARATSASGSLIDTWNSIPINGGKEIDLSLPVGGLASVEGQSALTFALLPNMPNPFNPATVIGFQIPETSDVSLVIYNTLGQQIRVLMSESMAAGNYSVSWDSRDDLGRKVSSGVYFYRLIANQQAATRRMVLLK